MWDYNANHQLVQQGETRYQYDANGNLTGEYQADLSAAPLRSLIYNAQARLTEVQSPEGTLASYDYDPMGRRVARKSDGETQYFLYNHQGLIGEYDAQGNLQAGYQYPPDATWGTAPWYQATTQGAGGGFYQHDHLGAPFLMARSNGQTLWQGMYDAFGQVTETTALTPNNLRFPGQWLDRKTGYHYNYFRDYAPQLGRYVQRDPIGLIGGVNTYSYVLSNPLKFIDALGLATFCESLRVIIESGPNQFTDGSDLYTHEITQETNLLWRLGLSINTTENIDLQYFLLQHNYADSADFFSSPLSVIAVNYYILIGSAVSAYNDNVGLNGYLNDVSADMRGNLAGYKSGRMGLEEYYQEHCQAESECEGD